MHGACPTTSRLVGEGVGVVEAAFLVLERERNYAVVKIATLHVDGIRVTLYG